MSEEQLARIEAKLDKVVSGQDQLRGDVAELRGDITELRGDVTELHGGQDRLREGQDELRAGQILLHNRFERFERTTDIAFEQLHEKVDLIAEGHRALEIKMDKGFAELREDIGRRLDPLERVVRDLTQ